MEREKMKEIISQNYAELVRYGHRCWNGEGEDVTNDAIETALKKSETCWAGDEEGALRWIRGIIYFKGLEVWEDNKKFASYEEEIKAGREGRVVDIMDEMEEKDYEEVEEIRARILRATRFAKKHIQRAIKLVLEKNYTLQAAAESCRMSPCQFSKILTEIGWKQKDDEKQMALF